MFAVNSLMNNRLEEELEQLKSLLKVFSCVIVIVFFFIYILNIDGKKESWTYFIETTHPAVVIMLSRSFFLKSNQKQ